MTGFRNNTYNKVDQTFLVLNIDISQSDYKEYNKTSKISPGFPPINQFFERLSLSFSVLASVNNIVIKMNKVYISN